MRSSEYPVAVRGQVLARFAPPELPRVLSGLVTVVLRSARGSWRSERPGRPSGYDVRLLLASRVSNRPRERLASQRRKPADRGVAWLRPAVVLICSVGQLATAARRHRLAASPEPPRDKAPASRRGSRRSARSKGSSRRAPYVGETRRRRPCIWTNERSTRLARWERASAMRCSVVVGIGRDVPFVGMSVVRIRRTRARSQTPCPESFTAVTVAATSVGSPSGRS